MRPAPMSSARPTRQRAGLAVVLLAPLALALVACGSSSNDPAALTTTPASTDAPSESPTTDGASTQPSQDSAADPTVSGGYGDVPKVTMPGGTAPTALRVKTLQTGKGDAVRSGDLLVVNYAGLLWKTGKSFDSSFDRGQPASFAIGVGQVIPGWDKGLVGQTVGSRVLLVIPPADGYGSAGQPQAGIKGDDTLVFAVDILATYPKA